MKFIDVKIQFRNYCLIERGMTGKNFRTIVRHLERVLDYLETENFNRINENTIREFLLIESQEKNWSSKTYITVLQSLRTFFRWCLIRNYVSKNPTDKVEKPRLPKRLPRCLTKNEVQKVFGCASNYNWLYKFERTRNLAILYTFLYSGVRLNELLNLKLLDVDINSEEIYIHKAKGGKNRIIPIHPELRDVLQEYINERKDVGKQSCWLFTGIHSNKRLYEKNVHELCKKISVKSGVKFTPHMLRHTFARMVCEANVNLFKLKEMLGHSHVNTTQIYLSVSKDGMKKSLGAVRFL